MEQREKREGKKATYVEEGDEEDGDVSMPKEDEEEEYAQ